MHLSSAEAVTARSNGISIIFIVLLVACISCVQTWCVAGNCFSLQKEHDAAIRYFQRAVQVDPLFAYAYTLLGHEYVMVDELDKALATFRNALRLDGRHYNAWYCYFLFILFLLPAPYFSVIHLLGLLSASALCLRPPPVLQ